MKKLLLLRLLFSILTIASTQAIIIEHELGSTYILWKWNCTNPNTTVNVSVDGETVMTNASCIGEYLLSNINENEMHMIKVVSATNESDYAVDLSLIHI